MRGKNFQICSVFLGLAAASLCLLAPALARGDEKPFVFTPASNQSIANAYRSTHATPSGPANMLYLRISRRFLQERADTVIDRNEPVNSHLMGADIHGTAHISGSTQFLLEDFADCAVIHAVFTGTIRSQTTGSDGRVSVDRQAVTPVSASKYIVLDGNGIQISETTATAHTKSNTTGIHTSKGGVRGRITQRVAQKRTAESQDQIDAIASQRATDRIRTNFDREVQKFIDTLGQTLGSLPKLTMPGENTPALVRFRSTPECIEIAYSRSQGGLDTPELQPPPPVEGDPLFAVRAHRSLIMQIVSAGNWQNMLPPALTGLLEASHQGGQQKISRKITWSPDGSWMTLSR